MNPHSLYKFLIKPLRDADRGTELLLRFLEGPQTEWDALWLRIDGLRDLMNFRRCPDEYLTYLKDIVGILDADVRQMDLSETELRRFISVAVALWKIKGTVEALVLGARVLSGRTARVVDWFDRRTVLDEMYVEGEEVIPGATVLYAAPGGAEREEYTSQIQLMDDGTLNRPAIEYLLELLRPRSERLDVLYLHFLDTGVEKGALWTAPAGKLTTDSNGVRRLAVGGATFTYPSLDFNDWNTYTAVFHVARGTGAVLEVSAAVFEPGSVDRVRLRFDGTTLDVDEVSAGGLVTSLASGVPIVMYSGVYYTVRVECEVHPSGGAAVAVFVDGDKLTEVHASNLTGAGGVGLDCLTAGEVLVKTVSVLPRPLTPVRVGPNP